MKCETKAYLTFIILEGELSFNLQLHFSGEGGREVAAGGKQPQYVDVNDQLKEVRNFCGNFVIVSGKIVNKMGENIGLVAEVFKALFKKT